jgi:hypothetical protein
LPFAVNYVSIFMLLQIKIDYLAEIIIIRMTDDLGCHFGDLPDLPLVVWTLKREVRAFGECLGIYRR